MADNDILKKEDEGKFIEFIDKKSEYLKAWHRAHPDYNKDWQKKHPGYTLAWTKAHPGKCLECGRLIWRGHDYCPIHKGVGERNGNWKGGRRKQSEGYVLAYAPSHPRADINKVVYEHRLVMESKIGRLLLPTEVVHHINGIRNDNRAKNLMLFSGHSEHKKHHGPTRSKKV